MPESLLFSISNLPSRGVFFGLGSVSNNSVQLVFNFPWIVMLRQIDVRQPNFFVNVGVHLRKAALLSIEVLEVGHLQCEMCSSRPPQSPKDLGVQPLTIMGTGNASVNTPIRAHIEPTIFP